MYSIYKEAQLTNNKELNMNSIGKTLPLTTGEKSIMNAFDKLVHTTGGKDLRSYQQMIKDAKPFIFGKTLNYRFYEDNPYPSASIPLTVTGAFTIDRLLLPFPTVAIVNNDCATVINDEGKGRYTFISYTAATLHGINIKAEMISIGYIDINKSAEMDKICGHVSKVYLIKDGSIKDITSPEFQINLLNCILPAMVGLTDINTIDRFVLEISSTKTKTYKDKYVPLLDQRPSYVILYPREIRKYMNTEHEAVGTKTGHERRAHLRRYPDDAVRYPNAHGKVIRIASVWVGSTEVVVGERKYRVVLDYYVDKEGNIA